MALRSLALKFLSKYADKAPDTMRSPQNPFKDVRVPIKESPVEIVNPPSDDAITQRAPETQDVWSEDIMPKTVTLEDLSMNEYWKGDLINLMYKLYKANVLGHVFIQQSHDKLIKADSKNDIQDIIKEIKLAIHERKEETKEYISNLLPNALEKEQKAVDYIQTIRDSLKHDRKEAETFLQELDAFEKSVEKLK